MGIVSQPMFVVCQSVCCSFQLSNKRRHSLDMAIGRMERGDKCCGQHHHGGVRSKFAYLMAEFSSSDSTKYQPHLAYRCWPPPLFIPIITVIQV
jgi:hypothetical protein